MNTNALPKFKQMSPQLLVANLEVAISFYTTKLGFTIVFFYEDFYAGIIKDGFSIHLKIGKYSINKNNKEDENLDILFSVDDIEPLYQTLSTNAVEITQPLREMPYGKEFYIADPDNHIIAFVQETE